MYMDGWFKLIEMIVLNCCCCRYDDNNSGIVVCHTLFTGHTHVKLEMGMPLMP